MPGTSWPLSAFRSCRPVSAVARRVPTPRSRCWPGKENRCFLPESQQRTFDYLTASGRGQYDLHIVPQYGHLDMFMGKDAARDVFPLILDALRKN